MSVRMSVVLLFCACASASLCVSALDDESALAPLRDDIAAPRESLPRLRTRSQAKEAAARENEFHFPPLAAIQLHHEDNVWKHSIPDVTRRRQQLSIAKSSIDSEASTHPWRHADLDSLIESIHQQNANKPQRLSGTKRRHADLSVASGWKRIAIPPGVTKVIGLAEHRAQRSNQSPPPARVQHPHALQPIQPLSVVAAPKATAPRIVETQLPMPVHKGSRLGKAANQVSQAALDAPTKYRSTHKSQRQLAAEARSARIAQRSQWTESYRRNKGQSEALASAAPVSAPPAARASPKVQRRSTRHRRDPPQDTDEQEARAVAQALMQMHGQ